MELRDAIRSSGAVRQFTDEKVPLSKVHAVLDDARFAASGSNRQPWRVAVVEDTKIRESMLELMQPTWDEWIAAAGIYETPFNAIDYVTPTEITPNIPNGMLAEIATIPVVLAVAADLRRIAMMDNGFERPPMTGGASIYPFCWNLLLSARAHGLGGVMTTFLSRAEAEAQPLLGLPEHHALVATIFLGVPVHQPTKLKRLPVESFATLNRFDGPPLEA